MKAERLLDERHQLGDETFAELKIWITAKPVRGSEHTLKYALALIERSVCVLRYDNEAGKGDHRHYDGIETAYAFKSAPELLADFWADVERWRRR